MVYSISFVLLLHIIILIPKFISPIVGETPINKNSNKNEQVSEVLNIPKTKPILLKLTSIANQEENNSHILSAEANKGFEDMGHDELGEGVGDLGESVSTQKLDYFHYYEKVKETIDPIWERAVAKIGSNRELQNVVILKLNQMGDILSLQIDTTSNSHEFDALSLSIFQDINKLPPPPIELFNNTDHIFVLWHFSII